jgi:hypothetical protein
VTGPELAKVLVDRLNELIAEPEIRTAVAALIGKRVEFGGSIARALIAHPTIQVGRVPDLDSADLGLVGLLNGICGADDNGVGYLAYRYEAGELIEFLLFGKAAER